MKRHAQYHQPGVKSLRKRKSDPVQFKKNQYTLERKEPRTRTRSQSHCLCQSNVAQSKTQSVISKHQFSDWSTSFVHSTFSRGLAIEQQPKSSS